MLRRRARARKLRGSRCWVVVLALTAAVFAAGARDARTNTVSFLSWDHDPVGHTIVTVVFTEPIGASSLRSYSLTDPPRAVVVIADISAGFEPASLTIADRYVESVRIALHPETAPPELLVVLDLATAGAGVLSLWHDGNRLSIVVGDAPPSPGPSPLAPTPTKTPTAPVPPTDTAVPILTPTAAWTPTPSPTPAPSTTPSPIESHPHPDRPAPPVLPPARRVSDEPPPPAPSPRSRTLATPTPAVNPTVAVNVLDISASHRSDESTLLRISADGRLPMGCARTLAVAGDPPRIIVTLRGLSAPDLPRTMDLDDPNISGIRLIHDAETTEGELHLVLHLARSGVSAGELRQVGPNLVVRLLPPGGTAAHDR